MWIDLFVSAPVTLFMLWLYRYSTPTARPAWLRSVDGLLLVLAPLSVIAIIAIGHSVVDFAGMGLNVMLVAAAYLTLIGLLGFGWMLRYYYVNSD
ncbi:MAG: hypothetical protein AAF446_11350 [Pseudomonadota bacterium]